MPTTKPNGHRHETTPPLATLEQALREAETALDEAKARLLEPNLAHGTRAALSESIKQRQKQVLNLQAAVRQAQKRAPLQAPAPTS